MQTKFTIGILGGGSLGLLYGAMLSEHYPVTIYTKSAAQAQVIRANGLYVSRDNASLHYQPAASPSELLPQVAAPQLLFIALKSYQLEAALPLLHRLSPETTLCFLSNGIAHLTYIENLPAHTLLVATSEHGAVREGANRVAWRGNGKTNYSYLRAATKTAKQLDSLLAQQKDFCFAKQADPQQMMYRKLIANSCINPLTAIWQVPNGKLLEEPAYLSLLEVLVAEVAAVLELEKPLETVKALCHNTAANFSSMATDIANRRPTEASSIMLPILRKAAEKAKPVPLLQLVYDKITMLEREG